MVHYLMLLFTLCLGIIGISWINAADTLTFEQRWEPIEQLIPKHLNIQANPRVTRVT